jgi:hypothetical protein
MCYNNDMGQHSKVLLSRTTRPGDSGKPQTLYLIPSEPQVPAIQLGEVLSGSHQELLSDSAALVSERLTTVARQAVGLLAVEHGTRVFRPIGTAQWNIPLRLIENADSASPTTWIGAVSEQGGSESLDRADIAMAMPRGHDMLCRVNIGLPGLAPAVTTGTEFRRVAETGTAADWEPAFKQSERSTVGELVAAYDALTRPYTAAPLAHFVSMQD